MIKRIMVLVSYMLTTLAVSANYEIKGLVIGIYDGDTIKILDSNNIQYKIRLADIDAPESGQPFGNRAKQRLQKLVSHQNITAICREKDRYKRNVCTVYNASGIDVNADLVMSGSAWVYTQYNKRSDLPDLQIQAQTKKIGLWGLPEAEIIKPSDWRHGQREVQAQIAEKKYQQSKAQSTNCGSKRFCKQMSSCHEAMYYLNQCGLSRLDRDNDGIPCESLCNKQKQQSSN
ncbi:thermonuclease family protein [Dichelobacter nodosus]|uniref:thermonuclease family protein n=1 Tax=Dichelobacter nodosus TaxID=870 RepID=UPI0006818D03|nr:thermonuclease family protein [Dichelobacter nodosus]KNZ39941.1 nuclease [Dichelobacter nodosus]